MAIKFTNILQVDVEDWYCDLDIKDWELQEDRVVEATNRVLDILKEANTFATFFVLGYVAEHYPELVERITNEGHEAATHGYAHRPITRQTPREFEDDLLKSVRILEGISRKAVLGYRAPQFSVVEETSWAIDILKQAGLKYDSSVFPVKTHLYGMSRAPLFPYHISSLNITIDDPTEDFLEVPLSVYRIPGISVNIPVAGGFYLRFFPYPFIRYALRKINRQNQVAVCYIHPWELDPQQPKISSLSWYHYWRLSSTEGKLKQLLMDFQFDSVRRGMNLG